MSITSTDDPPPYTPIPTLATGESTLELGPPRPFQSTIPAESSGRSRHGLANSSTSGSNSTRSPSLLRQLTTSLNNVVNQLDNQYQARSQNAYRGTSLRRTNDNTSSPQPPPPATSSSSPTSDFVRDFYAAGIGEPEFTPPSGPPPGQSNHTPDDGRPTLHPVIGHPLLNDGKVLVYPKSYKCHKCDNVGYKGADPSRPCKRCWNKYSRPFSGPLAYSFSSNSRDGNFQRPLPPFQQSLSIFDSPGAFPSPSIPTGFSAPPIIRNAPSNRPANAVVYTAGDPRIGGDLCWNCGGKGHVNFLFFDSVTCTVCNGVGRIFH